MQNRSNVLIELAANYVEELNIDVGYAGVGGSVGRGEADEYSDLDLIVYTNTSVPKNNLDVLYNGEIIQLDILDIAKIPNEQEILEFPWDYRFLSEMSIIKDNDGLLSDIIKSATNYFNSYDGKKKLLEQVSNIVRERIEFANKCLDENRLYSANIASMGAWAEAGFLYLFVNYNLLSTGGLIPVLEKLNNHIERFKNVSPFSMEGELSDVSLILSSFRQHLRDQGHLYNDLSEVHDTLCDRKIKRLLINKERLNLLWQIYGEAVGLYFETSNGLSLEKYFQDLPISLQNGLSKIGFIPLNKNKVNELSNLSKELLAFCYC
ncbi:nucleotidyltransferase domain-containing protein [Radiobacillus deserti]|uniref:nucleotidyltransferase domain-containing protein n=1 Tax=Radiobacillus deserti TaxID=2594883 RepID=UPI001E2DA9F2|nr:nucleotidyltransferase domain-containing protein [Radiobacillus deserti]